MYKTSIKQAISEQHVSLANCLANENIRIELTKDEQIKQKHLL